MRSLRAMAKRWAASNGLHSMPSPGVAANNTDKSCGPVRPAAKNNVAIKPAAIAVALAVSNTTPTNGLRAVAQRHPKTVYRLLFECASTTLKQFGMNRAGLNAQLGMTAVLHTHSRRLDYHPHVHVVVVPGGGVDAKRKQWRTLKGHYLFNSFALAKVFRAKMLNALRVEGLLTTATPKRWVVDCQHVGQQSTGFEIPFALFVPRRNCRAQHRRRRRPLRELCLQK